MPFIHAINQQWFANQVPIEQIIQPIKTPCYLYSKPLIQQQWLAFDQAFGQQAHQIHYAVKANSNLAILQLLASMGSGFDIVSEGELSRVLKAGGNPKKIVFSGVGKTERELTLAIEHDIHLQVESEAEVFRLNDIACSMGKKARLSCRINPEIELNNHPHVATGQANSKFGILLNDVVPLYMKIHTLPGCQIEGISCHIGSQITDLEPYTLALQKILALTKVLLSKKIPITRLNLGGGFGVQYQSENVPTIAAFIQALLSQIDLPLEIHIEPGRSMVADSGVLLTRVEYIRKKNVPHRFFAIVDVGMNDLMRPALYNAYQPITALHSRSEPQALYDIVGPLCENADHLGKDRFLALQAGDLLAIHKTGAYGASMSSNYNSRPSIPEILVDQITFSVIKKRETVEDLYRLECLI